MYTIVYTPEKELSSATVLSTNYLVEGENADITVDSAYYYPASGVVRLIADAVIVDEDALYTLTTDGVTDTDGNAADETLTVYLVKEQEPKACELYVSAYRFLKDGKPVSVIENDTTGITLWVFVANATTSQKTGTLKVYDGSTLCGEAEFTAKNEGFAIVNVDTSAYTFSDLENVTFKFE